MPRSVEAKGGGEVEKRKLKEGTEGMREEDRNKTKGKATDGRVGEEAAVYPGEIRFSLVVLTVKTKMELAQVENNKSRYKLI